jgi:hypothetical protein
MRGVVILSPLAPVTQVAYWEKWKEEGSVSFIALAPAGQELPSGWTRAAAVASPHDAWSHPRMTVVIYELLTDALNAVPGADLFYLVTGDTVPIVSVDQVLAEVPRTTFGLDIWRADKEAAFGAVATRRACEALRSGTLGVDEYRTLSASHSAWFAITPSDLKEVLALYRETAARMAIVFLQDRLDPSSEFFFDPPEESWWLMLYLCLHPESRASTYAQIRRLERATVVEARGESYSFSPFTFSTSRERHLVWMRSYGAREKDNDRMWLNLSAFILFTQTQLLGAGSPPGLFVRKVGPDCVVPEGWIQSGTCALVLAWLKERGATAPFPILQRESKIEWARSWEEHATGGGHRQAGAVYSLLSTCEWSFPLAGESDPAFMFIQKRGAGLRSALARNMRHFYETHPAGRAVAERRAVALESLERELIPLGRRLVEPAGAVTERLRRLEEGGSLSVLEGLSAGGRRVGGKPAMDGRKPKVDPFVLPFLEWQPELLMLGPAYDHAPLPLTERQIHAIDKSAPPYPYSPNFALLSPRRPRPAIMADVKR